MKANEAPKSKFVYPDKLYARTNDNITLDISYAPQTLDAVEYVRTDAFIEKALKWYCLDCICNDTCSNTCYFKSTFKKYLKGDDKQLPPKIENAINPDGSTTENYRYRQFISRMQDAFIEKACKFISDRVDIPFNVECSNGEPLADSYIKYASSRLEAANKIIEDFKKYMKGE